MSVFVSCCTVLKSTTLNLQFFVLEDKLLFSEAVHCRGDHWSSDLNEIILFIRCLFVF